MTKIEEKNGNNIKFTIFSFSYLHFESAEIDDNDNNNIIWNMQ